MPLRRSDYFNPESIWLDMKLSMTRLNNPEELDLVTIMVDGFVGLYIESRVTPKKKNNVFTVDFNPNKVVNPFDPPNALHDVSPVYWFTSAAVVII
jgi:hypothetical protein